MTATLRKKKRASAKPGCQRDKRGYSFNTIAARSAKPPKAFDWSFSP
jgi:hypothetical protein